MGTIDLARGLPGILSDAEIRALCLLPEKNMIEPFQGRQVRAADGDQKVISYGLSSCGYDIRLGYDFKIFSDMESVDCIDPKDFESEVLKEVEPKYGNVVKVPALSYALGVSLEKFHMPKDVVGVCVGKSTLARCGLIVNVTPLEPGWEGHLTIEISNSSRVPVKLYLGEGIAQVLFFRTTTVPEVTYADRDGKYQGQKDEITTPRM